MRFKYRKLETVVILFLLIVLSGCCASKCLEKDTNSYPVSSSQTANFVINQQNEKPVNIVIEIYNNEGELIHTIKRKELVSGSYTINWDGVTGDNHKVESGHYSWKLIIDGKVLKETKFYLED